MRKVRHALRTPQNEPAWTVSQSHYPARLAGPPVVQLCPSDEDDNNGTSKRLEKEQNTIRDGGSTELHAAYNVHTAHTVYTVDTVDMAYAVDIV